MKNGQTEAGTARLQQTLPHLARHFRVDCISISYFDGWSSGSMWTLPVFGFRDEKLELFLNEHGYVLPTRFSPPFQTSEIVWGRGAWPNGYLHEEESEGMDESDTQFLGLVREKASFPIVLPGSDGSSDVAICCLMQVDTRLVSDWVDASVEGIEEQGQIEPVDLCRLIAVWEAAQEACSKLGDDSCVLERQTCTAIRQFRDNWREEIRNSLFSFFGNVLRDLEPSCSISLFQVKDDEPNLLLETSEENGVATPLSELPEDFFSAFAAGSFTRASQTWRMLATPVESKDGRAHWIYPFVNGDKKSFIQIAMGNDWSREENSIPSRILITLLLEVYFDVLRCSPVVSGLTLRPPLEKSQIATILGHGSR